MISSIKKFVSINNRSIKNDDCFYLSSIGKGFLRIEIWLLFYFIVSEKDSLEY